LILSKGSPLPFEAKGSAPSVSPTLGRFFQPEAKLPLADKEQFFMKD